MADDLIKRLRSQKAVDGRPHEIEQLTDEAAAMIEQQADQLLDARRTAEYWKAEHNAANARIAELEAQIATVAPAVDAQPVAWRHKATKILRNDSIAKGADFEPDDWEPLYAIPQSEGLRKDAEPVWIVNDLGELGVKVGARYFFLYKGENIEYGADAKDGVALHDDGTPMHYRIVGKREFGETCLPISWVANNRSEDRYTVNLTYHPGLSFGKPEDGDWCPLPAALSQHTGEKDD
jgi:hypothetical protein